MCEILSIQKTRTTPYNPKLDGMIECFNRTLINMVATMINPIKKQKDWDRQLSFATFAYRSSPHESTGETPMMMMLGREVTLPVDLQFGTEVNTQIKEHETDYAEELRQRLEEAHQRAQSQPKKSARRQKKHHQKKHRLTSGKTFKEGDFAWLH